MGFAMRRLKNFLPIVLIALVVQIFAPIGACWAATIAASDPLAGAVICHGNAAPVQGRPTRPATALMTDAVRFAACCRLARRSIYRRSRRSPSIGLPSGWPGSILPSGWRTLAPVHTRRRARLPPFPDDLEHPMIGAAIAAPV